MSETKKQLQKLKVQLEFSPEADAEIISTLNKFTNRFERAWFLRGIIRQYFGLPMLTAAGVSIPALAQQNPSRDTPQADLSEKKVLLPTPPRNFDEDFRK